MKKLVSTLLALVMVIGLVGCKSNEVQQAISENSGKEPTYFEEFPDLPTPEIFTLGKISQSNHTYIYELSKDEKDSDLGRVAYCSKISTTDYTLEKTDDTYKNFTISNSGGVIAHISMYKDNSLRKYVLEVKIDETGNPGDSFPECNIKTPQKTGHATFVKSGDGTYSYDFGDDPENINKYNDSVGLLLLKTEKDTTSITYVLYNSEFDEIGVLCVGKSKSGHYWGVFSFI